MNPLKFKWQPGDIVTISGGQSGKTNFYIILGTTKLPDNKSEPLYLGKKFGFTTTGKFVGYQTKAFHSKRNSREQEILWFEAMQSKYLWDVKQIYPENLQGSRLRAYEAALKESEYNWQDYYEAQIKYIFKEAAR